MDYKQWILSHEESKLDVAEKITGVPREKIIRAAELLGKPREDGTRPKTSIGIEKGNYWSNNYLNTASVHNAQTCTGHNVKFRACCLPSLDAVSPFSLVIP